MVFSHKDMGLVISNIDIYVYNVLPSSFYIMQKNYLLPDIPQHSGATTTWTKAGTAPGSHAALSILHLKIIFHHDGCLAGHVIIVEVIVVKK